MAREEAAVIRELGYEANTRYVNGAYRSGFVASTLIIFRLFARSLIAARSKGSDLPWIMPEATVAFSVFKNERGAIEEYIRERGVDLHHVQVDLKRGTGFNFCVVIGAGLIRSPAFFFSLIREYGVGALRRFAYPFLGYALFCYLRKKLGSAEFTGTIVTTNMVHPVSLAIHYAALAAGWRTIYLEHAMTPRLIAKNRGYGRMLVRSLHTKQMLADAGIDSKTLEVLEYWKPPSRSVDLDTRTVSRLGVAINDLDDIADIEFLTALCARNSIRCEIRVHDADTRLTAFQKLGQRSGAVVSSAANSDIIQFIKRQDIVIVGNSSVLLDCLRANVAAIYYWPGPAEMYDYYGLVQYMQYPAARNRDELVRLLNL